MREHTAKDGVIKRPDNYVPTVEEQAEQEAIRRQIDEERTASDCIDQRGQYRHPRKFTLPEVMR
jgi:hypothetical protein